MGALLSDILVYCQGTGPAPFPPSDIDIQPLALPLAASAVGMETFVGHAGKAYHLAGYTPQISS